MWPFSGDRSKKLQILLARVTHKEEPAVGQIVDHVHDTGALSFRWGFEEF